jgi:hypothetical protein
MIMTDEGATDVLEWARELAEGCAEGDAIATLLWVAGGRKAPLVRAGFVATKRRILEEGLLGGTDETRVQRLLRLAIQACPKQ